MTEEEKTTKTPSKADDMEFVKRIVAFIRTKKPKTTSDFVEAGFFRDRTEGRKILREIAEKGYLQMEKAEGQRQFSYTLPPANKTK